MHNRDQSEILWLAFRYVADELSTDEVTAFEQRLADDQLAREAVAQATLLWQAAGMPKHQNVPAERERRVWLRPAGWLTVAIAAAVAGIALSFAIFRGRTIRTWQSSRTPMNRRKSWPRPGPLHLRRVK